MKKSRLKKLRKLSNELSELLSTPDSYHGYLQQIQTKKVKDDLGKEVEIKIGKTIILSKLSPRRIYNDGKRIMKDKTTKVLSDEINLKDFMEKEGLI